MSEREPQNGEGENRPEKRAFPKTLFEMGQIVVTTGAVDTLERIERHPVQLLARHVEGDWGDLVEHDVKENELSLEKGYRLFSAYEIDDVKFYVITEWDVRHVTVCEIAN